MESRSRPVMMSRRAVGGGARDFSRADPPQLSREQQLYYASITEALASGDAALCTPALASLRADPYVGRLLAFWQGRD